MIHFAWSLLIERKAGGGGIDGVGSIHFVRDKRRGETSFLVSKVGGGRGGLVNEAGCKERIVVKHARVPFLVVLSEGASKV